MRIQVTDNFFVEQSSEVEYTLFKKMIPIKGKKKGKIVYQAIGYYINMDSAIRALIQAKLFDKKQTVSLREFLAEYKRMQNDLTKQLQL